MSALLIGVLDTEVPKLCGNHPRISQHTSPYSWRVGLDDPIEYLDVYRSDRFVATDRTDGGGPRICRAHY